MLKLRFADRRRPAIWLVQDRFAIGSGPDNDLILPESGILPEHVVLRVKDDHLRIDRVDRDATVCINRVPCIPGDMLSAGDTLSVGDALFQVINPTDDVTRPAVVGPAAGNRAQWILEGRGEWLAGKAFGIDEPKVIGRDPTCDIVLAGTHLSRRHARLSIENDRLRVEDLGSVNGTWVNGKRVENAWLQAGDEVRFDILAFSVLNQQDDPGKTSLRPAIPDASVLQPSLGEAIAARMTASSRTPTPEPLSAVTPAPRAQAPPLREHVGDHRERLVEATPRRNPSASRWLWLLAVAAGAGVAVYGWFALS